MKIPLWQIIAFLAVILAAAILLLPSRRELGRVNLSEKKYTEAEHYLEQHYESHPDDIPSSLRYLEILDQRLEFDRYEEVAGELLSSYPNNPDIHRAVAAYYENNLQLALAAEHWERVLELDPKDTETRDKFIAYLHLTKQYDRLIPYYEEEIARGGAPEESYFDLARLYILRKRNDKAARVYARLLLVQPKNIKAKLRLAEVWEAQGKMDEALALYEAAAESAPDNQEYALRFLSKADRYHRLDFAKEALDRYLARFSNDPGFLLESSYYLIELGEDEQALSILEELHRLEPSNTKTVEPIAELYYRKGNYKGVVELLDAFHSQGFGSYTTHILLGDSLEKLGQSKRARIQLAVALNMLETMSTRTPSETMEYFWLRQRLGLTQGLLPQVEHFVRANPDNRDGIQLLFELALGEERLDLASEMVARYQDSAPHTPELYSMQAALSYAQKDWPKAREAYEKVLGGPHPTFDEERDYAYVLTQLGEYQAALKQLDRLRKIAPPDIDLASNYADLFLAQGDYNEAEKWLKKGIARRPDEAYLYTALGDVYKEQGRSEEAKKEWAQALAILEKSKAPLNHNQAVSLTWLLYKLEQYTQAQKAVTGLLEENPNDREALGLAARIALQTGEYAEARGFIDRLAAQAGENNLDVWDLRIERATKMRNWKEARGWLQKMLEKSPGNIARRRDYAYVLTQLGEYDAALEQLAIVKEGSPEDIDLAPSYVDIYIAQGQHEKAGEILREVIKERGGTPYRYMTLGDVYFEINQPERAREFWEKALALLQDKAEGGKKLLPEEQVSQGWLYFKLEEFQKASEVANAILEERPKDPDALNIAARVAIEDKNFDEANRLVDRLEKVMEGETYDVIVLRIDIAIKSRSWNDAERLLEKALEETPENLDRLREYAFVSTQLHQYVRAKRITQKLCQLGEKSRGFWWEQRSAYLEGGGLAFAEFSLLWAEDTTKSQIYREGVRNFLCKNLRLTAGALEEHHQQSGDLATGQIAINEDIFGLFGGAELFLNQHVTWALTGQLPRLHHKIFPSIGLAGTFQKNTFLLEAFGLYNEIIRLPISALPLEGRLSRVRLNVQDLKDDFLRYGIGGWWEWYTINPDLNPLGLGSNLGNKWFLEPFIGFVAISDTYRYLEFIAGFLAANWHQGFPGAQQLVDLLPEQRQGRLGMLGRQRWDCVELEWSAVEQYDWARSVNSVVLESILNVWWTSYSVGSLGFDYQIGDSGLAGLGNSWRLFGGLRYAF